MPSRCENCHAFSPSIKNEGQVKLYRSKLATKRAKANAANGINIEHNLSELLEYDRNRRVNCRDAAGTAQTNSARENDATERQVHVDGRAEDNRKEEDDEQEYERRRTSTSARRSQQEEGHPPSTNQSVASEPVRGSGTDSAATKQYMTPAEARAIMEALWRNDAELVRSIWTLENLDHPASSTVNRSPKYSDANKFFMTKILVPPNRFRPHAVMDGRFVEHPQNAYLGRLLNSKVSMQQLRTRWQDHGSDTINNPVGEDKRFAYRRRMLNLWNDMQTNVNKLLDSSSAGTGTADATGIRQQLEKKAGLFRMNLMGKRVNFAARSVISPDPYIHPAEIGVPPFVATRLTFPEPVTKQNIAHLQKLVENGSDRHPGARAIEDEHGRVIDITRMSKPKRRSAAMTLASPPATKRDAAGTTGRKPTFPCKAVYRHLQDGDMLLMNRQPTLHKPGVMAHRARILPGQRTLRLHYANCSTYNADFDGDEMNLHMCQDQLGRAESYHIVSANEQYTVPTDGKPLRGLIQDHVASGVLLTKKDSFLSRESFSQLLSIATEAMLSRKSKSITTRRVVLPTPALLKPVPMWTGKQLIGSVLDVLTTGKQPLSMQSKPKTPLQYFGPNSNEGMLEINRNSVLRGVVDKAAFGNGGLVHAVHEMYGSRLAGDLLCALSKLLTVYLQSHGLTCGVGDLLVTKQTESVRESHLARADKECARVAAEFAGVTAHEPAEDAQLRKLLSERLRERPQGEADLDGRTSGALSPITSDTMQACLPNGQAKAFPRNQLSLITVTGAKGSLVNHSQIAALLGQQELEGRRVPRMCSGKTLPCFKVFDTSARAGGFVTDRFLSGLRPPEYFFHCLAGREGLVDTAVKTARSGYLQRCLVKNLEGLQVAYDGTVRDCDGSMVQMQYGEDGIDNTQTAYLDKMDFYVSNARRMEELYGSTADTLRQHDCIPELAEHLNNKVDSAFRKASLPDLSKNRFKELVATRISKTKMSPGEPCGVIAAQSMGEPSTQMTLNTFHFAGRGGANVTLGIPRLRELLMTASKNISTPVMTLPILSRKRSDADSLASELRRTTMAELLDNIRVVERPYVKSSSTDPMATSAHREYTIIASFRTEGAAPTEDVDADEQNIIDKREPISFGEMQKCFYGTFMQRLYQSLKYGEILFSAVSPEQTPVDFFMSSASEILVSGVLLVQE